MNRNYLQQPATVCGMAPTTSARGPDAQSLNDRTRNNIRILKAMRQISDETIANLGGFTSRQVVADRVSGRTPLSLDDVDRIASALRVDRDALISPTAALMVSIEEPVSSIELPPMKGRKTTGKRPPASKSRRKSA